VITIKFESKIKYFINLPMTRIRSEGVALALRSMRAPGPPQMRGSDYCPSCAAPTVNFLWWKRIDLTFI